MVKELIKFIIQELFIVGTISREENKTELLSFIVGNIKDPLLKIEIIDILKNVITFRKNEIEKNYKMAMNRLPDTLSQTNIFFHVFTLLKQIKNVEKLESLIKPVISDLGLSDYRLEESALKKLFGSKVAQFREIAKAQLDQYINRPEEEIKADLGRILRAFKKALSLGINLNLPTYLSLKITVSRLLNEAIDRLLKSDNRLVINLNQVRSHLALIVGNKAAEIGEIKNAKELQEDSPPGFAITILGIYNIIQSNLGLLPEINQILHADSGDPDWKSRQYQKIFTLLQNRGEFPSGLLDRILKEYREIEAIAPLDKKLEELIRIFKKCKIDEAVREKLLGQIDGLKASPEITDFQGKTIGEILERLDLPDATRETLWHEYQENGGILVIVRSSSLLEDTLEEAMAGRFKSLECKRGKNTLKRTILDLLAYYWVEIGEVSDTQPILIQEMVDAEASIVANSIDVARKDWSTALVSACWGYGIGIVSGKVATDICSVDKDGNIVMSFIANKEKMYVFHEEKGDGIKKVNVPLQIVKKPALTEEENIEIARKATGYQKYFKFPIDLEAVKKDNHIRIVQVRGIPALLRNVQNVAGVGLFYPEPDLLEKWLKAYVQIHPEGQPFLTLFPAGELAKFFDRYIDRLYQTRAALSDLQEILYEFIYILIRVRGYLYDAARKRIFTLFTTDITKENLIGELKNLFYPEIKDKIETLLVETRIFSRRQAVSFISQCQALTVLVKQVAELKNEMIADTIRAWEMKIEGYAHRYFTRREAWLSLRENEKRIFSEDPLLKKSSPTVDLEDFYHFIDYLFPRIYDNVPRLKRLNKPTIVLIGAISGANIVQIVIVVEDKYEHLRRFETRSLKETERGGPTDINGRLKRFARFRTCLKSRPRKTTLR